MARACCRFESCERAHSTRQRCALRRDTAGRWHAACANGGHDSNRQQALVPWSKREPSSRTRGARASDAPGAHAFRAASLEPNLRASARRCVSPSGAVARSLHRGLLCAGSVPSSLKWMAGITPSACALMRGGMPRSCALVIASCDFRRSQCAPIRRLRWRAFGWRCELTCVPPLAKATRQRVFFMDRNRYPRVRICCSSSTRVGQRPAAITSTNRMFTERRIF